MSYVEIRCKQGSPEWVQARLGRLTASCAKLMLAKGRNGNPSKSYANLKMHLALEQVTGQPKTAHFLSEDMKLGNVYEPKCLHAYEIKHGELLRRVGFFSHTELMAGCSPDGLVDDDEGIVGVVEAKVRRPENHYALAKVEAIPNEFMAQCWHHLWMIPEAKWIDLASYCDSFPPEQRLIVRRLRRADTDMHLYQMAVVAFLKDVDLEVEAIRAGQQTAGQ